MVDRKEKRSDEVHLIISHDEDEEQVVMHMPNQTLKFGMPPETAVRIALALIRHAEVIQKEAIIEVNNG